MIGLPTETDDDIRGIGELVGKVFRDRARGDAARRSAAGCASRCRVSTFVPKAQTPFQWEAQIPLEEVRRRQARAARVDAAQGRRPALARRRGHRSSKA